MNKKETGKSNYSMDPEDERGEGANPQLEPTERSPEKRLMVVGIGASAGGLQALQSFFDALPSDTGMAFVVVTHLHPDRESHMAELLQTHTEMLVNEVVDMISVERDHVYVIPPNRLIMITDTHLDTSEFIEPRGLRTPIDHFFRSLASVHRNAVGIILSGGGTDGSVGIKAIKEQGGLLLVQQPEEAEYDSMPRAAISTGLADMVLPVRELAIKLMEYCQQPLRLPQDADDLSKKDLEMIQRILAQVNVRTGHDFSQYKRSTILRRIQRRMQLNGYATLEAYLEYLRHNEGEAHAMFNDLLIGVTNFFRDRESWEALAEQAIPSLFTNRNTGDPVRAWTIGCATGEEAYTLAILLLEHIAKLEVRPKIQVFASDLDEHALAQAREGYYPAAIEADVSPERLNRFFVAEGNHYQVRRELRDVVLFTNHSILRDPPFSHLDLVSCRNLLIYLQHEMQKNVFDIFHYALNPGGFLFLGSSESADNAQELFNTVDKTHHIYQARAWRGENPHIPLLPLNVRHIDHEKTGYRIYPKRRIYPPELAAPHTQHQKLLEAFSPPSILIDQEGLILHLSETAGRYLLQPSGSITNDLLKLVRPELQNELRTILFQAFDKNKTLISRPIPVSFNGNAYLVTMFIRPQGRGLEQPLEAERQALVIFLEDERPVQEEATEEVFRANLAQAQAGNEALIEQLEREVHSLRERLQTTTEEYESSNEEMKAANEELQSINEEYRSATEELETSKEELQSINEELQTVNNELKNKLEEISRANSDLENLMAATEIATLFLDRDLLIQRFTPGMQALFNLIDADRGRPISHLTHKLAYEKVVEDAKHVLRKLVPVEREVPGENGQWFLLRMRPYRTIDDRIDGVVVTFVEITQLKQAEKAQLELNETLEERVRERTRELDETNQKLSEAHNLFYTLFHANPIPTSLSRMRDGVLLDANEAYLNYFGYQREDILGRKDQGLNHWLEQDGFSGLNEQIQEKDNVRNNEIELTGTSGQTRSVMISVQQVEIEEEEALISSFIDITGRVRAERNSRALAYEVTIAEQKERQRIAQLLHDDLQQRIYAIQMQLAVLRDMYEQNDREELQKTFAELDEWIKEAISITRNLSMDLSPPILVGEGLKQAISWLQAQMEEQYGLEVTIQANEALPDLDHDLQILIFQAVRELLFNVVKHSGVLQALVTLEHTDDHIKISVIDEGKGFDANILLNDWKNAHGFIGVRHRLGLVGCKVMVNSEPGKGTAVTIEIPDQPTSDRVVNYYGFDPDH